MIRAAKVIGRPGPSILAIKIGGGTRADDSLVGTEVSDTIRGGKGEDTISGAAGDDTLRGGRGGEHMDGGGGEDLLIGSYGDDSLLGGDGDDRLFGSLGRDTLAGGLGDDYLMGGANNDVLRSSDGADTLKGGVGWDRFEFFAADGQTNVIIDFQSGAEKIDVSAIDADAGTGGDQAFAFVSAFTDHAGEAVKTYNAVSGVTTVQFDVDGNGEADLVLKIVAQTANGDFVL